MLTRAARIAPSSTLPDHAYDTLKFSPRSPIHEEDEDWDKTVTSGELDPQKAQYIAHSRESSLEKLQAGAQPAISPSQSLSHQQHHQQPHSQQHSPSSAPRAQAGASSRSALGSVFDRIIDSRGTYGHHRQTSIVHGIQHSRNGSLASSSSSPLSPQIIAAAGTGLTPERAEMHPYGDTALGSRPSTAMSGATLTAGPHIPERTSSAIDISATQRKVERMHSGKSKRDHAHHHSHSRHHRDEQKTVGEYALHVLFTSV